MGIKEILLHQLILRVYLYTATFLKKNFLYFSIYTRSPTALKKGPPLLQFRPSLDKIYNWKKIENLKRAEFKKSWILPKMLVFFNFPKFDFWSDCMTCRSLHGYIIYTEQNKFYSNRIKPPKKNCRLLRFPRCFLI